MLVTVRRTIVTTMELSDDERTEEQLDAAVQHRLANTRATDWSVESEVVLTPVSEEPEEEEAADESGEEGSEGAEQTNPPTGGDGTPATPPPAQ